MTPFIHPCMGHGFCPFAPQWNVFAPAAELPLGAAEGPDFAAALGAALAASSVVAAAVATGAAAVASPGGVAVAATVGAAEADAPSGAAVVLASCLVWQPGARPITIAEPRARRIRLHRVSV